MTNLISYFAGMAISVALIVVPLSYAVADIIDDNVTKAEKSVENANKRLAKAQECAANRPVCLADMKKKAEAAAKRANEKLAAINQATAE
jgi:F0F1-type ATP synthase membrane subunit b/b'